MTVGEAQREYNKLLSRYHKANEYFDRDDVSQEDKKKYLSDYQKILKGLSYLLNKITIYTNKEVLEGFHNQEERS